MKKKYLNLAIAIIVLILMSSCKKEDIAAMDKNTNPHSGSLKSTGISLISGRLVFSDSLVFKSYVKWVKTNIEQPDYIKSAQLEFGFKSLVSVYDEGMKLADSAQFVKYILDHSSSFKEQTVDEDPFYELPLGIITSFIANEFGVYQIGNNIIRETENYKVVITNGDETKLFMLFIDPQFIKDPSVNVFDYGTPFFLGQYSYKTVYFESKKRIVARLYYSREPNTNQPMYESRTTSQKKGWTGIWVQENITSLGQKNYSGIYYTYKNTYWGTPLLGPFTVLADDFSDTNISDVRLPVVITPAYKAEFTTSSCICEHWGYRGAVKKEIVNNDLFPDNF